MGTEVVGHLEQSMALRGHFIADADANSEHEFGAGHLLPARLEALDRYWSERTALISQHHHRELASAQSAVEQVIAQQSKLNAIANHERAGRAEAMRAVEQLRTEADLAKQSNDALWRQMGEVHTAKEDALRRLAEAKSEKEAVMQAGEVLLAELEQLHEARDEVVRKLNEEANQRRNLEHSLAEEQTAKADALAAAAAAAAAKTDALGRLAAAEGARKAALRRLAVQQEHAAALAQVAQQPVPMDIGSSAAATEAAEAEAQEADHLRRASLEHTEEAFAAAKAMARLAQDLRNSEAARIEAQRGSIDERVAKEMVQERITTLQQEVEDSKQARQESLKQAQEAAAARDEALQQLQRITAERDAAQRDAAQVAALQHKLKVMEAAAEAAANRAKEEADFRVDVAQGLNEELAARDRALRRAAQERAQREEMLAQLRRDLEDQEAATQDALRKYVGEQVLREEMARRLRAEQASLEKKLRAAHLASRNADRAAELAAVMQQVQLQKAEKREKDALQALAVEQASSEKASRRAALEYHRLEQQMEVERVLAAKRAHESAGVLARAEAERKRISDKYTKQRQQMKETVEEFKRAISAQQQEMLALAEENAQLRTAIANVVEPGSQMAQWLQQTARQSPSEMSSLASSPRRSSNVGGGEYGMADAYGASGSGDGGSNYDSPGRGGHHGGGATSGRGVGGGGSGRHRVEFTLPTDSPRSVQSGDSGSYMSTSSQQQHRGRSRSMSQASSQTSASEDQYGRPPPRRSRATD